MNTSCSTGCRGRHPLRFPFLWMVISIIYYPILLANGMPAPRILGVLRKDAIPYSVYDRQICTTDMPVINCLVNRTFFSRLRFIGELCRGLFFMIKFEQWKLELVFRKRQDAAPMTVRIRSILSNDRPAEDIPSCLVTEA